MKQTNQIKRAGFFNNRGISIGISKILKTYAFSLA